VSTIYKSATIFEKKHTTVKGWIYKTSREQNRHIHTNTPLYTNTPKNSDYTCVLHF